MSWILVALALIFLPSARSVQLPWHALAKATSPDARTTIELGGRDGESIAYRVTRDGEVILDSSPLGIRRQDQAFTDATLTFTGATDARTIDERYTTPHGKRHEHRVAAQERTVSFKNASGGRLEIFLHAQNDGVAFRYRFPEHLSNDKFVSEEMTGFHVPRGSTAWLMPQQEVHKYGPAYEDFYEKVPAGTASSRADGWAFPALFKTPTGKWLLITESGLDETYCGAHLAQNSPDGVYRLRFPDPKEGLGVGAVEPKSPLPWATPWRVVIVGDRAGDIIESDLVLDVAPRSRIGNTSWIKPGRAAWSWWSKSDSPKHAEDLNAFTDLAAEMGWEYALVDANWNFMETGTIQGVIAHAKEKHVGLLFWYNSGGPHNNVTEAPRDRMTTHEQRVKEMTQLRAWGVKGIKVDFWQSDKQDRIAQYRDLMKDAADFQLMVDFHGSTIPRGWQREFPNLIGMEAVAGAEQYKFREDYAGKAPWLNTVLPFTRNVAGPMDYTPVTFSDAKYPHRTTNAHELALSVVFETAIQHFADSAESYRSLPEPAKTFLSRVPTVWDDTRALSGEPGESVVIARRNGDVWYVGGINGRADARTVRVDLGFLKEGSWRATIVRDGDQDRAFASDVETVSPADGPSVTMRPRGGFVMRIERTPARQ